MSWFPLLAVAGAESPSSSQYADFVVPLWTWFALIGVISLLLIGDLLIVHRKPHDISFKEAAIESAVWISIGLSFTFVIGFWQGSGAAGEYLSGYLIEKSLSIDNVFVWAVIFSYFAVPAKYQFRVLFWGIFGALVLRFIFIFAGVALITKFEWVLYIFGAFLIFTGIRMARHEEQEIHPEDNPVLKIVRRIIPMSPDYDGQKLFTRGGPGKVAKMATPLFAVLIMIESTDVVFAVDSIPAILAVSRETFIVFASNAFAILGLRALYFCLAGMSDKFRYLNIGLGIVLGFVGCKMLLSRWVHLPTYISLGVIIVVITTAVLLSLRAERKEALQASPNVDDLSR